MKRAGSVRGLVAGAASAASSWRFVLLVGVLGVLGYLYGGWLAEEPSDEGTGRRARGPRRATSGANDRRGAAKLPPRENGERGGAVFVSRRAG